MEQMTLSKADLATMLGKCIKSVENYEKAGILPKSFKLGKSRLWWKAEVIAKINESREAA